MQGIDRAHGHPRHHSVTTSGWKRGFYTDAVDSAGRSNPCISSTRAYSVDGIDRCYCVFKSNGRLQKLAVGSIPTYPRHPLLSKAFWGFGSPVSSEKNLRYLPKKAIRHHENLWISYPTATRWASIDGRPSLFFGLF